MSCSLTCPVTVHCGLGDSLSQNISHLIDIRRPQSLAHLLSPNVATQKLFWTLAIIFTMSYHFSAGRRVTFTVCRSSTLSQSMALKP